MGTFAHVTIRVTDRDVSERFYRTVLEALGIRATHELAHLVAWDDFAIIGCDPEHAPTRHLHVAFVAPSRSHVDEFWRAGIAAAYLAAAAPGNTAQCHRGSYGAFLFDPDGNTAGAVCRDDVRRGGNVDHLTIGVRELLAGEAFYTTIAPHTGLRPGLRRNEEAVFLGSSASFSLVQDGRSQTDGLHLAFRAPDSKAVDDFHRAAVRAGYRDNGGPGERPWYGTGYYAAFVLDPDGTNIESVWRHE